MHLHLSPGDGKPIYLQIVNQVKYLVASGRLTPGEELPPIRVLAEKLLVNPNTVARAYRELEVAGVVTKRRTAGTYVSDAGSPLAHVDKEMRYEVQVVDRDGLSLETPLGGTIRIRPDNLPTSAAEIPDCWDTPARDALSGWRHVHLEHRARDHRLRDLEIRI